jgi:hypothetical protein
MEAEDNVLQVAAPLFVLTGSMCCWKCDARGEVIALSALSLSANGQIYGDPKYPGLLILAYIVAMPKDLERYLAETRPHFRKHYSKTADQFYFANTCLCGANYGDHYMHGVDGPFFPRDEVEAAKVSITRVLIEGPMTFRASFSEGPGDKIWKYGTHG